MPHHSTKVMKHICKNIICETAFEKLYKNITRLLKDPVTNNAFCHFIRLDVYQEYTKVMKYN